MKKRLACYLMACVFVLGMVPANAFAAEVIDSGSCGDNVTYTLYDDGLLEIAGMGEMTDCYLGAPWDQHEGRIESVVIQNGVTSIGNRAFYFCTNLASVSIPNSVTSIGWEAFYLTSLTSVNIPNSVTYIEVNAFSECKNLTNIWVDNMNAVYSSQDGVLFNKNKTELVCCPAGKTGQYSIPNSVTSIGKDAFCYCSGLTSVSIPNSVTSIGENAFSDCSNLISMNIPDGVASIGYSAFFFCTNLTSVSIPNSVTSVGQCAFAECNLKTAGPTGSGCNFEFGWTNQIPENGFYGCRSLTNVSIPSGVTHIGEYAFWDCISLTSIQVDSKNAVYSSQDGVLFNKNKTELVCYPAGKAGQYIIPNSVTSIGKDAFLECSNLKSVSIPNSVTSIGENAFLECSNLKSVSIPSSVTSIGYSAFSCCSSLTDVYYGGTEGQWGKISIESGNECLTGAKIHYNSQGLPRDKTGYYITPIDFGDLTLNVAGTSTAYFRVEDKDRNPLPGITLQYTLDNGPVKAATTDGNGLLAVTTPRLTTSQTLHASIYSSAGIAVYDGEQDISVMVKQLSYTQEWTGGLKGEGEFGFGPGVGASVGVAEAEASLLKASIAGNLAGRISIADAYDDGVRTLTAKLAESAGVKGKIKSGIDASTLGNLKLDVISAKAGFGVDVQTEHGLKLQNYDPTNRQDRLKLGSFVLLSATAGSVSVFSSALAKLIDPVIGNTMAYTTTTSGSGNADVLKLTFETGEESELSGSVAGGGSSWVHNWTNSYDSVDKTTSVAKSFKAEVGYGLGSGIGTSWKDDINQLNAGKYLWGASRSNNKEISVSFDEDKKPTVSYKTYRGDEQNRSLASWSTDKYATVSYSGDSADLILRVDDRWAKFSQGSNPFINIQKAIDMTADLNRHPESYNKTIDVVGTVSETTKSKIGLDFDFPFGVSMGASGKMTLGITGEQSYSYKNATAALYRGSEYNTTSSEVTLNQIEANAKSLWDILTEPVTAMWEDLKDDLSETFNTVKTGVTNAYSTVKGTVSGWYASITTPKSSGGVSPQSYGVLSLMNASEPDTNAAVSATLGDPYVITVYTDDTCTQEVTDQQLAENPLTLTLEYTDEMLDAAGAAADADVLLFWFDRDKNLYVYQPEGEQDKAAKTVTAPISRSGEYILAVDTAAPVITDFTLTDATLTPSFTALVSDLSGIDTFYFWLDDGQPLVTQANLSDYYDSSTGVFNYSFDETLTEGEHTARFLAKDTLGNENGAPVEFSFEVHALKGSITSLIAPTETITEQAAFPVTVECSQDNDFTALALFCAVDGTEFAAQPMTQENGVWTADVTPIAGADSMELTAVACDESGNSTAYGPVTVTLALPEISEKVIISDGRIMETDGNVTVSATIQNVEGRSLSGILMAAVYRADGKMLGTGELGIGMTSGEQKRVDVSVETSSAEEAGYAKIFLLDTANGYSPQCLEAMIKK